MSQLAVNPQTGEAVYLDKDGQWKPAQRAVNPQTKEILAYDGAEWKPIEQKSLAAKIFKGVDDTVRSIASGMTFGWADELAAKANELTGTGTYQANVAQERARDESIPLSVKLPGEIAGAIGTTVLSLPLAAWRGIAALTGVGGQGALATAGRFGVLGAAEGAIAGAGGAKEGERGSGAATGALIGAPVGAVAPSVVSGIQSAARGVRGAFAPEAGAAADLGRAITRDETTAGEMAARVIGAQADRPGMVTAADVGGENVRGLAERVAQTPGSGRSKIVPALTQRQTDQAGRITEDLRSLTGTRRSAYQTTEAVVQERAAAASPLYQTAYEAGDHAVWSSTLERLSGSPTVQNAMRGAVKVWQDNAIADGFGAMNPGAMVSRGGRLEFLDGKVPAFPNIQFWDYTKRIIDDQIGTALRVGENQKARTLTRLQTVLRSELDTIVPEYRAARDAWAGPSAFLNAIDDGRGILSKSISAEEMTPAFRALSPSEQEGYRIGAISSIVAKMGNDPARLADMTKYLRAPEVRAKIAAIMPNEETAAVWARRLDFETRASELTGRALGGPATARRLAEAQDAKGIVGDLVKDALVSGPASASFLRTVLTAGPRWLRDTVRSRTDRELADVLMNPARMQDLPDVLRRAAKTQGRGAVAGGIGRPAAIGGTINVAE